MCGWHKFDNACPIKITTVASLLRISKIVMKLFRNRTVASGVVRSKRELYEKAKRIEASRDKRKIRRNPTPKV